MRRGLWRVINAGKGLWREAPTEPYFALAERLFFTSPHLLSQVAGAGLSQPYSQHAWVYGCVSAIAQNIMGIPLLFYTGTRKDKRLVGTGPLLQLFEKPNPMMSGAQLIEAAFIHLGLSGEAFFILDRDSERELPREIWVVPPQRFKEIVDEKTGLIVGWKYRRGAQEIPLQPHEVIFFRYYNPYHDYRGMSPLAAAQAGIEQDYYASLYNKAFFRNNAQPGGVLETSANLSDEEFQRLKAQWADRHQGVNKAHTIAILEGGLSYKQTGLSQKDMDFLEQRKWNRDEIMMVFKVPKGELGIYEDINFATAKTQDRIFWTKTLMPKMAMFEWVLWSQLLALLPGPAVWCEFDYTAIDALKEDFREKVENARTLWQMGVPFNVANEALDLGLPAIPGGDVGYLPFNVAPVGQQTAAAENPADESKHWPGEVAVILPPPALSIPAKAFDAEAYWQNYLKLHTPLEEKVHSKIKRFFYEQRRTQLQIIEEQLASKAVRDLFVESLLFDLATENDKLQKVIWPLYVQIGMVAGQALYEELGQVGALFNLEDTEALAVLEQKLIKVVGINETTREALRATISEGLLKQEPWKQIADRVREVYNFAASRSYTIARTEVGQAMGAARYAGIISLGVQKIRWVTAADERVRTSHRQLNGVTALIGETFVNGCRFPCDPYGPAKEIINCRCVAAPIT